MSNTPRKRTAKKTAATKSNGVLNLADVLQEMQEENPPIRVQGKNGVVFEIPSPALWSDEVQRLAEEDPAGCQQELLGDQYQDWVKQGGTWGALNRIVAGSVGVDVGKSSAS